jgi:uncharacterized protein YrzB (UPF0473 family)
MKIIEFGARQLEPQDYDKLVKWWEYYGFPPPPKNMLPDEGTCGMILYDTEGNEYCAGFLYETNSQLCWIEYIVANPDIKDKEERKEALKLLITYLTDLADVWGNKYIFASIKHPSLKERYLECGFLLGTDNTTELIKVL